MKRSGRLAPCASAFSTIGQKGREEVGNPERDDEKVARQPPAGGGCRSSGTGGKAKEGEEVWEGTVGILEGPSAIWGTERPRRGRHSAEGMRIRTRNKRKKYI